ncbi:MAG: HTTM domain-containing protein [Pirellulaceae bacterium]
MAADDTTKSWLRRMSDEVFGIDARSLAAFRWCIALMLLTDLYVRWPTLVDFQTDQGLWTRELDREYLIQHLGEWENNPMPEQPLPYWSLHLVRGELWYQQTLFAIQAVAAVLLAIGYRTRLMTFISWALLISMHVRNPVVLNSGDTILRMLLFWSLFLPLGARWSVDRAFRRSARPSPIIVTSMASAAILIQLCLMYWFTGLSKYNDIWLSGQALENVLNLDLLARPISKPLLAYPQLLKVLSWATLWAELILPCLLFIPWKTSWWRMLNIVAFHLFHIVVLITISVGLFSAISMSAWLLFLPRGFWNSGIVRGVMGSIFGSGAIVEEDPEAREVGEPRSMLGRLGFMTAQGIVAAMLVFVIAWNIHRIDAGKDSPTYAPIMPTSLHGIGASLMVSQEFKMFDTPTSMEFWFVYDAQLKNGDRIDLFSGKPVIASGKPDDVHQRYLDHRWRRMHANLVYPEYQMFHRPLLEYFVKRWNENHAPEHQVMSAQLDFYERVTGAGADESNIASKTLVRIEPLDPLQRLLESAERSGTLLP